MTDETDYDQWVELGRAEVKKVESGKWRLGEFASAVVKKYKEGRLQRYAQDIGVDLDTLKGYRDTFLAWKGAKSSAPNFSVARALNHVIRKDPERVYALLQANPKLSSGAARK